MAEHAKLPISLAVDRILEVIPVNDGMGGLSLAEATVAAPYLKDYDFIDAAGPTRWADRFDTSNWGLICARQDGARVGGAVIAWSTPGVHILDGRDDVAVLWDIRACRFYRKMGCTLGAIDRFAYPDLPGEVQLLWWKPLAIGPSQIPPRR
ncbi:MAG TPA: hypothetical protein VMB74_08580 [Streptosporangiaceae bacterium]|nr:hypothetical protein [Streptosporangiaceae bacterium]